MTSTRPRRPLAGLRKTFLLAGKILVAAGLLAYVLAKVHWRDYAVTAEGKEKAVLARRIGAEGMQELQVATAGGQGQWLKAQVFRPVSLRTLDGQAALVIRARPDWQSPRQYLVHLQGRQQWLDAGAFRPGSAQAVQRGFRTTMTSAKGYLLGGSFACFILPVLILSVRWWYLLGIQDIRISCWEAVRLTFLGTFFNYVVPGTVSGDLVKAYYVAKHTQRKAAALVAIFVDRAVGLLEFAMLPAVVIALTFLAGARDTERLVLPAAMVAAVLCSVTAGLAVLLSPWLRRVLHLQKIAGLLPLQRHIAVAAEAADLYRRRLPALVKALAMTLGGQASFIVAILLAGLSLALPVPWHQYFLYVPLIYIIAAVPISPGGLGLTEAFFVTFLSPLGASPSEVLALALVARLFPMIVSLPGIIVALTGPKLPRPAQMRTELDAG
jgi:hypothetical protein